MVNPRENSIDPIYLAHLDVLMELRKTLYNANKFTEYNHLDLMVSEIFNDGHKWPIDKVGRWTGFIQGVLFSKGLLTVEEMRESTRPIFHTAYKQAGLEIPRTIEIKG